VESFYINGTVINPGSGTNIAGPTFIGATPSIVTIPPSPDFPLNSNAYITNLPDTLNSLIAANNVPDITFGYSTRRTQTGDAKYFTASFSPDFS
jgi:hypothetical protein